MRRIALAALAAAALFRAEARADRGIVPVPPGLKPTEILVLGTPHLRELPDFPRASLEPLLEALARFRPEVIAVEQLPPEVLEDMDRRGGFWGEVAGQFAAGRLEAGKAMQARLGIGRKEAETRAERLLRAAGGVPPGSRAELAALLVAALDQASAVLQWSRLTAAERAAQTALPEEIVSKLTAARASRGEDMSVGVELARRLGLERIRGIDDQFDASVFETADAFYPGEIEKTQAHPETTSAERRRFYDAAGARMEAALRDGRGLLEIYRRINSPEHAARDVDYQWGSYLRMGLPSGVDRARLAQWEARNLAIAAHVRKASAFAAGGRVLVIIGTAHLPFLQDYLRRMADVRVVPFAEIAGAEPGKG